MCIVKNPWMGCTYAYYPFRDLRDVQPMLPFHDKLVAGISGDKDVSASQLLLVTMKLSEGDVTYDILIIFGDVALANRVKVEQGKILSIGIAIVNAESLVCGISRQL